MREFGFRRGTFLIALSLTFCIACEGAPTRRQFLRGCGVMLGLGGVTYVATEPNNNPERHWDPNFPPQTFLLERLGHDRIGRPKWFASVSGVLITPRHVLVAAHTVGGEGKLRMVGLNQPPILVSKVTIHPDYARRIAQNSPDHWNVDMAVLELSEASVIEPALLPDKWVCADQGIFCGFGRGNHRTAGTPLSRPIKFETIGFQNLYLAQDFLMTTGDSGGGLFIDGPQGKKIVVGMAVGSKDNSPHPSYSLLVSLYDQVKWIKDQLK